MIKIDVLIVYEHVARELESALLLQQRLEKAGLTSKVVQISWTEHVARFLYSPRIIVVPWCYDDIDYDYFRGYIGGYPDKKFKIVNIHCEQIGDPANDAYMIPTGKAKDVYHFIWGEYFNQKLLAADVDPNTIYITGNPRLDFFREDFSYVSLSREELAAQFSLSTEKKWAMIIGSFWGDVLLGSDVTYLEERGYTTIDEETRAVKISYAQIMDWIETACNNPEIAEHYELIYRPHPTEPVTETLSQLEAKYKNFHTTKEYAIRDWMINSDVLFSWNSTSAVEAVYSQKPLYLLRPIEITSVPFLDTIEKLLTVEEFQDCLIQEYRQEAKEVNMAFKKEISFIYNQEQIPTVDRMVAIITKIIQNDDYKILGNAKLANRVWLFLRHYIKRVANALGILQKVSQYAIFYSDTLSKKEYRKYVDRVQKK